MDLPTRLFTGATVIESILVWSAATAFLIGAAINASAHPKVRAGFVQLGFPFWWCWVTSALEFVTALLLITAGTFYIGAGLGACIMLAAIACIIRIRNYRELPPPALFLLLLVLAGLASHS
jgi:hypothetical protein